MKRLIFISLLFAYSILSAQVVRSVDISAEYSKPGKKLSTITKIDGVGANVKIAFPIYRQISLNLFGGYTLYNINEDNALANWQWEFWTRYNDFVRQTLTDAAYKNFNSPVQKADLLNIGVSAVYDYVPVEKFHIKPNLGFGIYFYTRRLFIDETWSKYFSTLDYTFQYEFRNIAPEKNGNTFFYSAGVDLNYEILEGFWLFGSVKFANAFKSKYSYAFNIMPFKNTVNTNLGLTILY